MKLPAWFSMALHGGGAGRTQPGAEIRLQVLNTTRHTQLASSMEVADHGAKRTKGLLGRKGLGPGEGLWILPCEAVHTIGMQFTIDLVFLDRRHRIRKVRSNVPPWRMSACLSAHSVIELAAGVIRETCTEAGDFLEFFPAAPPVAGHDCISPD